MSEQPQPSRLWPPTPTQGDLYEFMGRYMLVTDEGVWTWSFSASGAPVWMWWTKEYARHFAVVLGERYK